MAIAFEGLKDYEPKIEIYRIEDSSFSKIYTIITAGIDLLDFSKEQLLHHV